MDEKYIQTTEIERDRLKERCRVLTSLVTEGAILVVDLNTEIEKLKADLAAALMNEQEWHNAALSLQDSHNEDHKENHGRLPGK